MLTYVANRNNKLC